MLGARIESGYKPQYNRCFDASTYAVATKSRLTIDLPMARWRMVVLVGMVSCIG